MANTKEIQERMASINDTLKITNAMYMISSSKLKKSKKMLEDTEPYFLRAAVSDGANFKTCSGYGKHIF